MSEMIGLKALACDWNLNYKTEAHIDATAAVGIIGRRGLGRVKHIDTVLRWAQEKVDTMNTKLHRTPSVDMIADLLTKFLGAQDIFKFISRMGFSYKGGNHGLQLRV